MKVAAVRDISEQIRGVTYAKSDASAVPRSGYSPMLRANNIGEHGLLLEDLIFVPNTKISPKQRIIPNDIVVAASSGSISVVGKTAQARIGFDGGFGAFCKVLRPGPDVDPHYFGHYFKTSSYRRLVSQLASGANINNLKKEHLDNLLILLPPLAEQKRIAGILDAADALRAKRREALAQLDTLLQSTFLDMFGDPVTNPKGWMMTCVGDVTQMGTGSTPSRNHKNYFGGSISWVKSAEVDWGIVTATSECLSSDGVRAARLRLYPKGSIVLALYGQGKTRGKCAVLGIDATINQACCSLVPRDPGSTPYLFQFLKYSYHRLRDESRGGNQENLNMRIVRSFPVPAPPLDVQQRYATIAESVETQKTSQRAHLAELDTLFASLQSRAFRGDL